MRLTKKKLSNLFFFIGVVAVVVMLFSFKVSFIELWGYICDAGYWLIPIVGIWLVIYGMNALAWWQIIKSTKAPEQKVAWGRIFKLTISGYALNYATPIAGLGGEPYRIMELSKDIGNEHATSSVILYVMSHMLAHILFWLTSVFILLGMGIFGDIHLSTGVDIVMGLTCAICILIIYFFSKGYKNGIVLQFISWLGKLPGLKKWSVRFKERHEQSLHNIDEQIAFLNQQDKKTFYSTLSIEYLARFVQSLEIMFMLLLFGYDGGGGVAGLTITFLHSVIILAIASLFSNILGFLPMQLGGQEGGFVLAITLLGIPAAFGMFVCIISRVREIMWILIGLVLMKIKS